MRGCRPSHHNQTPGRPSIGSSPRSTISGSRAPRPTTTGPRPTAASRSSPKRGRQRALPARTPRLPHPRMARETLRQTAMDDRYVHQPGVPVNRERRTRHLAFPAIRATTHADGKLLFLSRLPAWGRARAQRLRFLLPMRHRGQAPDIRRVTAPAVALRRAGLRRRPTIRTAPSASSTGRGRGPRRRAAPYRGRALSAPLVLGPHVHRGESH